MAQLVRNLFPRTLGASVRYYSNSAKPKVNQPPKYIPQNRPIAETLKNGVKVGATTTRSHLAAINIDINTGSAFENESNNGVTYLIKHLLFAGKEAEFEQAGATVSVWTSRDRLTIQAQGSRSAVPKVATLLAETVFSLPERLNEETLAQGKKFALQEKAKYESCVVNQANEHLHALAYQLSPYGNTVTGVADTIQKLTVADVKKFIEQQFVAEKVAIAGAGHIKTSDLRTFVEPSASKLTSGRDIQAPAAPLFIGSSVHDHSDNTEDVYVNIGFQGASTTDADVVPLLVLREIIGNYSSDSGVSSYSSTRIAELLGTEHLAESFETYNLSYANTGLFGFRLKTNEHNLEDVVCETISELVRLAHNARPVEVSRAVIATEKKLRANYNTVSSISNILGKQLLFGIPKVSLLESLQNTNERTIRELCTRKFTDTDPVAVAIGNSLNFPDYNQIRGWTHWWRI